MPHTQTPSQTVGPFFSVGLVRDKATDNVLVTVDVPGERIHIEGYILDGEGDPIDDALLEIWQADAQGHYVGSMNDGSVAASFSGFGRAATTASGRFSFETIKPGCVRTPGGRLQAPHLNVVVFARGL